MSAPPPFGGNQRTVVVRADPERLRSYAISPDELITALTNGNTISPSGNVRIGKMMPIVPINSLVRDVKELETIPIRVGANPSVYIRDVATVQDATDIPAGYALVNGRRAVYILVTKRADASTLSVVRNVKEALPKMQAVLPDDIKVSFEFDQSPTVTNAVRSLATEGALGAVLTGLMVLLFLRDWRSVIVVVLNIPFAICGALVALWLTGQTINLMTLGGLALAIGILVDEATVEIENIHHKMEGTRSIASAVRQGNHGHGRPAAAGDALHPGGVPAVVLHAGGGAGAVRAALAGGRLRDGLVLPALEHVRAGALDLAPPQPSTCPTGQAGGPCSSGRATPTAGPSRGSSAGDGRSCRLYLALAAVVIVGVGRGLGLEIFPKVDAGRFQLRMRARPGRGSRRPRSWRSRCSRRSGTRSGRTTWRSPSATSG